MKKTLLILIFTFLIGCGFKPIYSSDKKDFNIIKIETNEKLLNKKFSEKLKLFSNEESKNRLVLNFNIEKEKLIKAKNKKDIPSIFELRIKLNLTMINQENKESSKEFLQQTKYSNDNDKFELGKYEKELENTLTNQLLFDVVNFISNNK